MFIFNPPKKEVGPVGGARHMLSDGNFNMWLKRRELIDSDTNSVNEIHYYFN